MDEGRKRILVDRLTTLIDAHAEWSRKTFGTRSGSAPANHLSEEAKELAANPKDLMEGADCLLLLLDWMDIEDFTFEDLLAAAETKHLINKGREWGEANELGFTEHVREGDDHHNELVFHVKFAHKNQQRTGNCEQAFREFVSARENWMAECEEWANHGEDWQDAPIKEPGTPENPFRAKNGVLIYYEW